MGRDCNVPEPNNKKPRHVHAAHDFDCSNAEVMSGASRRRSTASERTRASPANFPATEDATQLSSPRLAKWCEAQYVVTITLRQALHHSSLCHLPCAGLARVLPHQFLRTAFGPVSPRHTPP